MAREKFQTLTEQMFYLLLCLKRECYGLDLAERVEERTRGRVVIGPGTLYHLLESFLQAGMIRETKVEGRRRRWSKECSSGPIKRPAIVSSKGARKVYSSIVLMSV